MACGRFSGRILHLTAVKADIPTVRKNFKFGPETAFYLNILFKICYNKNGFRRKENGEDVMEKIQSDFITLTQFLKMQGFSATGGQAKQLVLEMKIYVNGEREKRRGRKLYPGDKVVIDGRTFVIG